MIDFRNVTKEYQGHTALKEVSFSISQGSIFGLLGPNGAGKTTLLRILTRMLLPDRGEVLFDGKLLTDDHLKNIGYLPEERGLYPKMEVADHIHFLSSLKGVKKMDSKERLKYWAEELDIASLLKRKVENLSKGQQQKIQLIACLIHEPDLVILDEPFSGFDPVNAEILKNILLNLRSHGKTIIISTHRMDNAEELCDEIAMVHQGQLVLNGKLKDILGNHQGSRYRIKTSCNISDGETYQIVSNHPDYTLIQVGEGITKNKCLTEIMLSAEIESFSKESKTLREVFLEKAK